MAGKLSFSLVSPEREVFNGLVDQVDAPGAEGDFGVLADHAPFMTALREGVVTVIDGGSRRQFEVHGGFADHGQGITRPAGKLLRMAGGLFLSLTRGARGGVKRGDGRVVLFLRDARGTKRGTKRRRARAKRARAKRTSYFRK